MGRVSVWSGAVLALAVLSASARAEDVERGAEVFEECAGCHDVGKGAENRVGPHLNGLFGRRAAGLETYDLYSDDFARAGAGGLVWTVETLDVFIENPRNLVTGTRMSIDGVESAEDRAALIAYLRRFSDDPSNIPEAAPTATARDPEVADAILGIDGDPDYGEYLAGECASCHQAGGTDGIPSIYGWPTRDFVTAMHAYKGEHRQNPVMRMVAARLSNEEIAALAAYFEGVR